MAQKIGACTKPAKGRLGRFIRGCRLKRKLSQKRLAKKVRLDYTTISDLELGKTIHPPSTTLEKLARGFRLRLKRLEALVPPKKSDETQWKPETLLGKFIRARRRKIKLSLEKLAKKLGKKVGNVRKKEKEGIYLLSSEIPLWAKALKCPPAILRQFSFGRYRQKETGSEWGRFIRSQREEFNLSEEDVAKEMRVERQNISLFERRVYHRRPQERTLRKLKKALERAIRRQTSKRITLSIPWIFK